MRGVGHRASFFFSFSGHSGQLVLERLQFWESFARLESKTKPESKPRELCSGALKNTQNSCAAAQTQTKTAALRNTRKLSIQAMDNIGVVRLKLTGCGQSLELEVENGETVGRLLDKCAEEMGGGVSRRHVKLVARGKNLDESQAQLSLEAAGIRDRTKMMIMHTANYHAEKAGVQKLAELSARADAVADPASAAGQEMLTQLLCEVDGVDAGGSEWLRAQRKALVKRLSER